MSIFGRTVTRVRSFGGMLLLLSVVIGPISEADEPTASERGYRTLRTKPFLPADFDQEVFENLWKSWPEPLRSEAEHATAEERRKMAFARYGLISDESDDGKGPGIGYVPNGKGGWVMNCLVCHGGRVAGKTIPGLPNSEYSLETLTEEVRLTKLSLKKPLSHMDLAQLNMPLGSTVGTTNSVMFGVALGALRDSEMNVDRKRPVPPMTHHDMDPPPFWNVRYKSSLYCDGFAPKNARVIMQFLMLPSNDREKMQNWESDYEDILAWIESVQPPKYPFEIDRELALRGQGLFNEHCSRCHGTYGADGKYVQQTIPLREVGTDPVRLEALTRKHREWMKDGWMSRHGRDPVDVEPAGYVAPPLHGIWASAPYFHNGSVPTLWHVLNPGDRPTVWRRTEVNGYDRNRAGFVIETMEDVPDSVRTTSERRLYFDTRRPGKSARGHRFPEVLTEDEKRAVLEYLKTL